MKVERNWSEKEEKRIRLAMVGVLILLLLGIHVADPSFYPTIVRLSRSGDLDGTIAYLSSFGMWAFVVSFFIDVLINIAGFLPSIFLSAANGLIFGLFWGTMVSWIGETVGVVISFWMMRVLFRGMAEKAIEKSRMLTKLDQYSTWQALVIARAVPYMPNGLITALAALSSISWTGHMVGSFIGKLPSVALEVVVGHDIVRADEHALRLTVIIIAVSIIYGVIWWYMKKKNKKTAR